jgi:hypothetical protein
LQNQQVALVNPQTIATLHPAAQHQLRAIPTAASTTAASVAAETHPRPTHARRVKAGHRAIAAVKVVTIRAAAQLDSAVARATPPPVALITVHRVVALQAMQAMRAGTVRQLLGPPQAARGHRQARGAGVIVAAHRRRVRALTQAALPRQQSRAHVVA